MQEQLQPGLKKILNLPLTKTTRNETIQYFHFGHTHYTTPQGLVLDVGAYTLAVNCPWQLQYPNGDVIKHNEVFMRKREPGLPSTKFDWKVPGANLRDQRLQEFVNSGEALIIEHVELQENYSFILHFAYGAKLIVTPDASKPTAEYWQLFSNTGDGFRIGAGEAGIL